MAYDSPNHTTRREANFITVAGATTEGAKFMRFQALKLKAVHFSVVTAGTDAAHGYNIFNGTTSIAAVVLGTGAAGSVVHSATLNATIPTMGQVSVKSLADVVGVADVVYEYDIDVSAVKTA